MKNKATPKKLFAMFLAATMVCTMLQCTFLTAFAEAATIDELIEAVNADGEVTPDEVDEVNKISMMYDELDDQSAYTTTVSSLKTSLYTLLSEGLTTKTTDISNFNSQSAQWNNVKSTSPDGNAVRIKYLGGTDPQIVVGPHALGKTTVAAADTALDGLEIMINNYYQFQTAPRAGFAVQFTRWEYQNSNVNYIQLTSTSKTGMLLYFDLANSKIIINSRLTSGAAMNVGELALDDAAKAKLTVANFSHKAITIGMHATGNAENPYKVVVRLSGDSTPIVANIPAEHYSDAGVTNSGKVCIGFTAGYWETSTTYPTGNVATVFDVLGYRNAKTVEPVIYAINKLNVDTVTEADAKAIYDAVDNYSTFTELDKAQIDATKLDKLEEKLVEIAAKGYTLPTSFGGNASDTNVPNRATMAADGYATILFDTHTIPSLRISASPMIDFDGAEFKFARFRNLGTSEAVMGFGIHFIKGDGADFAYHTTEGVLLYVDIANGKLILNQKDITGGDSTNGYDITVTVETLISDSDVIKSLRNKIFTLGIDKLPSGKYQVVIETADGQSATAEMALDESLFLSNGKTYYAFNRGVYTSTKTYTAQKSGISDNSSQTKRTNKFDFFGCANTKNTKAVDALIAALPEVNAVTTNDGNAIFEAEEAYATLTDDEKALVDNAKLTAVRAQYDALFTAETKDEEYTVVTDSLLATGCKLSNVSAWWGAGFAKEVEDNGIRLTWGSGKKQNRLSIGSTVNMDGLNIRFNNFKRTGSTKAELSILLSRNSSNEHKHNGSPHFAVVLDTAEGTLKVSTKWSDDDASNRTVYDIIEDDLLKYENIAGAKFTVGFEEVGELEYKATVTVGNNSVSGIIPAQAFADVSMADDTTATVNALYNPKNCHFAVAAWSGNAQTVDVVGFKTGDTVTATKIAGATLTVSDSISVNYKVNSSILSANQYVNPEIKFEIAGSTITVVGEKEEGTGYYNFTYPDIAPHLMNETITATLYAYRASNLEEPILMGDTKEYSIKEYCYNILEKHSDNEELCDLVVDLLRYGAASQTYVDKDVENLVTADLTPEQNTFGTTFVAPADSVASKVALSGTPATKSVSWKAVALYLAEVVNLRYRFELAENVDVNTLTVQATVNGEAVTVDAPKFEKIGTNYYLYFNAFTAANLRDVIEVTVCDAEGNAVSKTATYSVESYVKAQLAKSPEADYEELLRALLCYGDSAKAYKN